jgi:hypothetical protein
MPILLHNINYRDIPITAAAEKELVPVLGINMSDILQNRTSLLPTSAFDTEPIPSVSIRKSA